MQQPHLCLALQFEGFVPIRSVGDCLGVQLSSFEGGLPSILMTVYMH